MSSPKVSIITVTYNSREALKKTMASVASQRYECKEYIVVDGASVDGTKEVLENCGDNVTQWVSEPDDGIYNAMNKGVGMSTGEWLIFMNAGDTFASDDVLEAIFSEEREGDVIYGDVVKEGRVVKAHVFANAHRMCFCHQSSLTRRELLRECPFDENYRMSADFKFFKLMGLKGKRFIYYPHPVACFDTNGVSNVNRAAGLKENIQIVSEVDGWKEKVRLLPRLFFTYSNCKLREKLHNFAYCKTKS